MIKVLVADDHPLMLEGVKRVLNREVDIEVIGDAQSGEEVKNMLVETMPDILILDLTMPGRNGLDLLKDVKVLYPDLPVLILSIHPEERFAIRCIKAGAVGYLCKSGIVNELTRAIRKIVLENRKYITVEVAEQLASQVNNEGRPIHTSLSDREFEVLCMIAEGKNVQIISNELSLSPHTIHTYRSRIKEKLNLSTNVEMTHYAIKNQLID